MDSAVKCTHVRVNAPDDGHLMTGTYVGYFYFNITVHFLTLILFYTNQMHLFI
jgi:hypothetical protein